MAKLWWNSAALLQRNATLLHRNLLYRLAVLVGAADPCRQRRFGAHQLENVPSLCVDMLPGEDSAIAEVDDGLLWAVPKKRTSHSKKRTRMAHKYLKPIQNYTVCPKCNNLKLLHVLCGYCLKETLTKTAEIRREKLEKKRLKLQEKSSKDCVDGN